MGSLPDRDANQRTEPQSGRRLFPPAWLRARRLRAYYDTLNNDPDFADDLRRTFHRCARYLDPTPGGWARAPELLVQRHVEDFARRWHLPAPWVSTDRPAVTESHGGAAHTYDSLMLWLTHPERNAHPPTLGGWLLSYHIPDAETVLVPPALPTLPYDPTVDDPAAIDRQVARLCDSLRAAMTAQREAADAAVREAGWSPVPSRLSRPEALRQGARRLLRAVRGATWPAIAKAETEERLAAGVPEAQAYVDPDSVRKTVNEWADALCITLPARPSGPPPARDRVEHPGS